MGHSSKKNKYEVSFTIFGESFKKTFKCRDKADFFLRCVNESNVKLSPKTIKEGFKKYLETESIKKSQSSMKQDIRYLKELESYLLSKQIKMLLEVRIINMEEYQSNLFTLFKGSTVNRRFNTIKHCFKKLVEWEYLLVSPCIHVRSLQTDKEEITLWSENDIKALKGTLSSSQDTLILDILCETGARISSVMKLREKDINLDSGYISFSTQKGPYRTAKTYKAPIGKSLSRKIYKHLNSIKDREFVFTLSDDKIYTAPNYCKRIQRALKKIKLNNKKLKLHGLRHTFATRLSEQNIPIKTISKLLGHSNTTVTEDYIHSTLDSLRKHLN